MDCITNNPFRVLGLYANASERDLQRNRSEISAFLTAGKPISFNVDFPFLKKIDRRSELVDTALAKIQLNQDKLLHSLFWFTNGSHVDEPAFNALETGQADKAADIWGKVTTSNESLHRYSSAFNNLGTLKLIGSLSKGMICTEELSEAIRLKISLISSEFFHEYARLITDETYKPDCNVITQLFAYSLLQYLDIYLTQGKISPQTMVKMFSMADKLTHDNIIKKLSNPIRDRLSKMIDVSKGKRRADPRSALVLGSLIFNDSLNDRKAFRDLVGSNSIEYQNIADKLADEILQCAIDHFNAYKDSGKYQHFDSCKTVIDNAMLLAVGSMVNQRIDENRKELIKWVEDTPERIKFESVKDDLQRILTSLETASRSETYVGLAQNLVNQNSPCLERIRSRVGSGDDYYIKTCTMVANVALQILITVNNNYQSSLGRLNPYARAPLLEAYKSDLKGIWEVFPLINALDMDNSMRNRVAESKQTTKEIMTGLGINPEGIMSSLKKIFFG